jgi:integrase
VARPRKAEAPAKRRWAQWSIDFHKPSSRWRARPPASVDPKRSASYHATREAAERWATAEIERLAAAERSAAADITLGDWLGLWFLETAVSKNWSVRTRAICADHLWWFSPCHDILLRELVRAPLQRQVVHLLTVGAPRRPGSTSRLPARPLAHKGVRDAVNALRRAIKAAQEDGRMKTNPAAQVDVPRVVQKRPTIWTAEERAQLAPVIATDNLEALWVLLFTCGLRIGEALVLDWDDLDEGVPLIRIHRTLFKDGRVQDWTKSKRPREVLLPPVALAALRRHRERARPGSTWIFEGPEAWAFKRRGGAKHVPYSYDGVRHRLVRLCERAGIAYHPTHTGRHVHATNLLASGVAPADVAERLGHASAAVTLGLYAHATAEGARRATEVANLVLGEGFPGAFPGEQGSKTGLPTANKPR